MDNIVRSPYINGNFNTFKPENFIKLINPVNEKEWITVDAVSTVEIEASFKVAFENKNKWKNVDARTRGNYLFKLAELVERDAEYLAELESKNTGVSFKETKGFHIPFTINCLKYFAGWADKNEGTNVPIPGDFICITEREPLGVISAILPWNFPLMLLSWKLGPSLATGNCLIVKPSPYSPLTALHLGKLAKEAGIPGYAFQVLPCNDDIAENFVINSYIDKITFTGSTNTAKLISQFTSDSLKKIGFELGGKSPVIFLDDINIDKAVKWAHMAIFLNCGQNCCAGSRIYVHENIYDAFLEKSLDLVKKRILGDPMNPNTDQGPVINRKQFDTILNYLKIGVEEGGKIAIGGKRFGDVGYFIEPTIFTNVDETMTIVKEEIFGPVMCLMKFSNIDEVIERANNTIYGLAAGIFTNKLDTAMSLSKRLQAGTIWINSYNWTDPASPFGGFKLSGNTKDLSKYALENYTQVKSTIINYGTLDLI